MFMLSVAWSFAFLHLLDDDVYLTFCRAIRDLGSEADSRARSTSFMPLEFTSRGEGNIDWIQTRTGIRPSLSLDLHGMITIHKPTDWEVDGLVVEEGGGDHPPLSAYVQSVFPRGPFPLVHDVDHNYGFLHRLDIPSSGLVLGGTTFEGYYCLRLQLDTQRLRREYMVVCHGLPLAALVEVVARVDIAPDPSQRKSVSESGKPSQTLVCLGAHIAGRSELEEGSACIVAIRIFTGRRHQIRVHLRFSGLPSVADARYTAREALLPGALAAPMPALATAAVGPPAPAPVSGAALVAPARRPLRMCTYH